MQDQPLPNTPDAQFSAWKQAIEERLRALETAPRLTSTSQRGGTYALLDDNGDPVFYFGEFQRGVGTPAYGVQCIIPDGAGPGTSPTVFEVDDDGLEAPYLDMPVKKNGESVTVTSGTFASIWYGSAALIVARAVKVGWTVVTDAATTAEVRIRAGSVTSSVVTCAAGAQTNGTFNLLLAANSLGSGPLTVNFDVRRASGAGNVYVYEPNVAQCGNDGTSASATGL